MKLVLIEWLDSHVAMGGWKALGDLEGYRAPVVRSVGWLTKDDATVKVLVPHFIEEQGVVIAQGCGEMLTPTRSVLTITELRRGRSVPPPL